MTASMQQLRDAVEFSARFLETIEKELREMPDPPGWPEHKRDALVAGAAAHAGLLRVTMAQGIQLPVKFVHPGPVLGAIDNQLRQLVGILEAEVAKRKGDPAHPN